MQRLGNIEDAEMYRTFNMGIGMVIMASEKDAPKIMAELKKMKEPAYMVGSVVPAERNRVDLF